jgi:hypothetical protein
MSTSSITSHRTLHLVDLENLVGNPRATGAVVHDTLRRYLDTAGWRPGDHVIVASNPGIIREFAFNPQVPCNVHACKGTDGADAMLLALAQPELVARRYARVVIGSGDGVFASVAGAIQRLGVHVLVVARSDGCSHRLRRFDHAFVDDVDVLGDAA